MTFEDQEIECISLFSKWFSRNKDSINRNEVIEELKLTDDQYETLIKKMEHYGAIENVRSVLGSTGYAVYFQISPYVTDLDQEIERKLNDTESPADIIDQLITRVRSNPWSAWPIIIFLLLALLIPFLNNFLELIRKFLDH
ncbi:MAG: hypothetical protein IID32_12610 [Planctomycetes bacterium]|nr:hypothetical protein [Planctomycetota bacterium]